MSNGEDHDVLRALEAAIGARTPVVLATVIATARSVPRHAGTKMLVYGDGRSEGTVGGGAMESRVIDEAASVLSARTPKLVNYSLLEPRRGDPGVCGGEVQIYLEPYMPPPTLLVIGAGHVGKAVVDLADWLGYHTIAVDDRGDRLTAESMPHADERLEGSAADVLADVDVGPDTSVVVVSREMNIDVAAVSALIGSNPAYIGVMGSKRRWRAVRDRLIEEGVPSEAMEQISVPIGLELGAETVEEIAVSIMAEVIGVRRRSESSPAG